MTGTGHMVPHPVPAIPLGLGWVGSIFGIRNWHTAYVDIHGCMLAAMLLPCHLRVLHGTAAWRDLVGGRGRPARHAPLRVRQAAGIFYFSSMK